MFRVIICLLIFVTGNAAAQTAIKQVSLQEEEVSLMRDLNNVTTELFEADSDEHKVRVYRLLLKVPERTPPKGSKNAPPARSAKLIATRFRLETIYHVATSERREAQTEALFLGANALDAMKIDREHYDAQCDIEGKPTMVKLRYFAGTTLVASQDLMTSDEEQSQKTVNRILKLEAWARAKSGN